MVREGQSTCWIIGMKATLPNGHEYITEPYIVFPTKAEAESACDMVEKVSRTRPMMAEAAFYQRPSAD